MLGRGRGRIAVEIQVEGQMQGAGADPGPAPGPAPGPGSKLVFPLRREGESKTDVRPGSAELGQVRVAVEEDIAAAVLDEAGGFGEGRICFWQACSEATK